jgi:hypothetical protein
LLQLANEAKGWHKQAFTTDLRQSANFLKAILEAPSRTGGASYLNNP